MLNYLKFMIFMIGVECCRVEDGAKEREERNNLSGLGQW